MEKLTSFLKSYVANNRNFVAVDDEEGLIVSSKVVFAEYLIAQIENGKYE